MFEDTNLSHSPTLTHNTGSQETQQQRLNRIKKTKNIRKEKVLEKRSLSSQINLGEEPLQTKDNKKELQKEKNRVAAQISRDRQKKYVEDLQNQIADLEKQLSLKLCFKCKATISVHSTSEQQSIQQQNCNLMDQPKISDIGILNYQEVQQFEEFPLIRDNSRQEMQWGNIGKYFCLFMMVFAVALLSNSVQSTSNLSSKQMSRILTQESFCQKKFQQKQNRIPLMKMNSSWIESTHQVPSTMQQLQGEAWPFKQNTGSRVEQCKNDFWDSYLQNLRNEQNPYDWNLVSCTNPNLVHISTVYEQAMNSLGGKWTFLITNPTVSHSHVEKGGNHFIDQVNYLQGIYQLVAEGVVLKKVMGENCLT